MVPLQSIQATPVALQTSKQLPPQYMFPAISLTPPQVVQQTLQPCKPVAVHRQWDSNLCDCCIDLKTGCYAFICPCCAMNELTNYSGHPSCCRTTMCCLCPFGAFCHAPYRKKLRVRYNLPAKPCNDCCVTFWCPCCALAQEMREIEHQKAQGPPQHSM